MSEKPARQTMPDPTDDIHELRAQPYAERLHTICLRWALGRSATPAAIYLGYLAKYLLIYIGGWWFFCSLTPGMGGFADFTTWAMTATAFQKAVLWSLAYEGLGLGCSSGPMTGRFLPPIGGVLHFARPGTTKLPQWPGLPLLGGTRRTFFDVALYAAIYVFLIGGLVGDEISLNSLLALAVLIPLLGLSDKTTFLAFRGDHYFLALICLCFLNAPGPAWIAGAKAVWFGIWFWAAASKLNSHFPSVIAVMLTNSPFIPQSIYRRFYREFPTDLRPSGLATRLAHFGTVAEFAFPIALVASAGGPLTPYALAAMLLFHSFIASNAPSGMPIEWNIMMVFGGFVLFGHFATVPITALTAAPALLAFLTVMLIVVPLVGNFFPRWVSFLLSMRYYAGNWAYSVWLFHDDAADKLARIHKVIPTMREQLGRMIDDEDAVDLSCAMTPAFRLIHIQGRALHTPLALVADDLGRYDWHDGEMIAGMVLGWNFGDGHLHDEQLIDAVQERCDFAEGELRVIIVESQPLFGKSMSWRVVDAKSGRLAEGETLMKDMNEWQPWPTGPQAEALK